MNSKHFLRMMTATCAAVILTILNPAVAGAIAAPKTEHIVIRSLSPESETSAAEEMVELYNPGASPVDITGWKLQYRSASSTGTKSWATKATAACQEASTLDCKVMLDSHQSLIFASYTPEDVTVLPLTNGMPLSGGQVRLVGADGTVWDMVGYGLAAVYEGSAPAIAPKAGQGLIRVQDSDSNVVDTDDNAADFVLVQPDVPAGSTTPDQPGKGAGYPKPTITEVFPDPVSPALDSNDEFIELYNPYDVPLDLTGYVLKTGTTWSHSFTMKDVTIDPLDYAALTSAQTHLSLSNSGSGVRLYDPAGALLVEVPSYDKAKPGQSWSQNVAGQWEWTTTPTPDEQNVFSAPAAAPAETASATKVVGSQTAAKKAAAPKQSKPSTSSASTKKSTSTKPAVLGQQNSSPAATPATVSGAPNYLLLGAVGALAAGYGLYEYRQELAGFVRRRWQAVASAMGKK